MKKVVLLIIIIFPIVAVSQTASECVERGDNYFNGKNGVTKTYYEAVKWYKKAADMGDAKGICSLARMYDYGYGVSKDSEKAEELYLKSAGMGYALAQFYLGDYYDAGMDYNKAIEWFTKAGEQGYAKAYFRLGDIFYRGRIDITKDMEKALYYYEKGANLGDAQSQYIMGNYYLHNSKDEKKYEIALKWYEKASAQGYFEADKDLAIMYLNGIGVPEDNEKVNAILKKWRNKSKSIDLDYMTVYFKKFVGKTSQSNQSNVMAGNPKKAINNNIFAVVIANEDYQNEIKVDYAKNDGELFKACCIKTLGVPEKNIHFIQNATLNNLINELDWLQQVCDAFGSNASVIFYYAGHGIPDEATGAAYLLPADGNSRILRTCFSVEELYATLGKLPAKKVTVMMDACFSGAVRSGGMLASARGVAIKAKTSNPLGNMVVLSAAQGNETAYKYDETKHGLFTYFLLKKLNESNGNVTLGELSDYVIKQVKRESIVVNGKSQTPSVLISDNLKHNWQNIKLY